MKLNNYQTLALKTESPITGILKRHKKQDITTTLTEFRVMHAGLGIITEIAELEAFQSDFNYREEIGDLFWYLALGYAGIGVDYQPSSRKLKINRTEKEIIRDINAATIVILDWTKARIFYNRTEKNGKTFEAVVKSNLDIISIGVRSLVQLHGLTVQDILTENIGKLKERYPEKYTDSNANSRDYVKEQKAAESSKSKL